MANDRSETAPGAGERTGTPQAKPGVGLTYASAGVDLERYDGFTATLPQLLRRTHGPRVIDNPGGFAGLFRLDYDEQLFARNYRDPVLVSCCDGVGTKIKLAIRLGKLDTIGIDLVAMNINDLIVQGAEPLFFLDYVAINSVDRDQLDAILRGIARGCEIAGCALLGGETAEMGDLYKPGDFDLAGFAVGVVELRKIADATRVQVGDVVLALASSGIHSNGYSLVNKIVDHAGLDLGSVDPAVDPNRTLGEVLLEPTRIYANSMVRLGRAYRVKRIISGMAHITGGGLAGNLCRSLPENLDAVLRPGSWEVPPIFGLLQRAGNVADDEMARVFNMGVGYCIIVRPAFADSVTRRLERLGERVFRLGMIEQGSGEVRFG